MLVTLWVLKALCKAESNNRPCPRMLLLCCTAIASAGLEEKNLFKDEAPEELVDALADHLQSGMIDFTLIFYFDKIFEVSARNA